MLEGLTNQEWRVYEWQYGLCGDFRKGLWQAIIRADDHNLNLLALGFPDEVNGYRKYAEEPGWWQEVEAKANQTIPVLYRISG